MKNLIIAVALAAMAGAGFAAGIEGTSQKIKAGKVNVGTKKSLSTDGRFHRIHGNALGLPCSTCHVTELKDDYLLLRKDDKMTDGTPGPVDRSTCLSCHKEGGPATTYYGSAGK